MKMCAHCSVRLDDDYSFNVCPRCLLDEALNPQAGFMTKPAGESFFPQLPARSDFYQKYALLEEVARGGQGEIWKVWDFEFRRTVAMKRLILRKHHPKLASYRFLAEAQITSQLQHPGILPLFDLGCDPDGNPYFTTQLQPPTKFAEVWCEAQAAWAAGGSLSRALDLLSRVCEVLAHAHSRGVIHCDLKPENLLVGDFGEVRVIDWGSARILPEKLAGFEESLVRLNHPPIETDYQEAVTAGAAAGQSARTTLLATTVAYAAPELLRPELDLLGPRTDIYSLGVMLYELLSGRHPYADSSGNLPPPEPLKAAILAGPPPRLRSLKPDVPRDLAAICEKAMARDRLERYASAEALMADLRAYLAIRPVAARQPGPWQILQKWALRNLSYVLIASFSLTLLSAVLAFAHGLKVDRDSARQIQDVRNAELAARNGHWREALTNWDQAAAHGYGDSIYLNLQKAEAWTVLGEPARAGALLHQLAERSDLGGQRGVVLLRLGEHELAGREMPAQGLKMVQEAVAAGLTNANLLFAQGLLADASPAALDFFHKALLIDPYFHGAHVQSLSFEFLLGHHQELTNHEALFKILYPDDPLPDFIKAVEVAMSGNLAEAQAKLASLRGQVNSNLWNEISAACPIYAKAAEFYDVNALLGPSAEAHTPLSQLRTNLLASGELLMPQEFAEKTNRAIGLRISSLPCLQKGLLAMADGLARMQLPHLANLATSVQEIESGWRHHPEALFPVLGGMLLEQEQPNTGPRDPALLQMQARLYHLAAAAPSMIPALGRLARYLDARAEFDLAGRAETNATSAGHACVEHCRQALMDPETSLAECQAYFEFASALGQNELALELVRRMETQAPQTLITRRSRIKVELALGAYGPALEQVENLLSLDPADAWARTQHQAALAGLRTLMQTNPNFGKPNP